MYINQRKKYPMVVFVTLILAVAGILIVFFRDRIPENAPNVLIRHPGEYIRSAATHEISWKTLDSKPFELAKRQNKPVLLVIGNMGCTAARKSEEMFKKSRDIIEYLKQDLIPVRIDNVQNPEWNSVFLPLSRGTMGFDSSTQFWILSPDCEPITALLKYHDSSYFNRWALKHRVKRARTFLSKEKDLSPLAIQQKNDHHVLLHSNAISRPKFERHYRYLEEKIDPENGGFPMNNIQLLLPQAWWFLLKNNELDLFKKSFDPVIQSPIVDWLRGGFFQQSNTKDWSEIEFDKHVIVNAEMAYLLAAAWCKTNNPIYKNLSEKTFDMILRDFCKDGLAYTYQKGDEDEKNRSTYYSIDDSFLMNNFNAEERVWLIENFSLYVPKKNQKLIHITDWQVLRERHKKANSYLSKIKSLKKNQLEYGGKNLCYINTIVSAKLLSTARLLNDQNRLNQAGRFFVLVQRNFRSGVNDVSHTTEFKKYKGYLGDYLGYVDAALQYFLAFNNVDTLYDGYKVLQRALNLFNSQALSLPLNSRNFRDLNCKLIQPCPNIIDDNYESLTAMCIRLCYTYGCMRDCKLVKKLNYEFAQDLLTKSALFVGQLAGIAENIKYGNSGYYNAALLDSNNRCILVVGDNHLPKTRSIEKLFPAELVIPIKKGHMNLNEGIYVLKNSKLTGPISMQEILNKL